MRIRIQRMLTGILAGVFLLLSIFMSVGCGRSEQGQNTTAPDESLTTLNTVTGSTEQLTVLPPPGTESGSGEVESNSGEASSGTTAPAVEVFRLPIYTMNADTLETEAVSVLIQATEITPQLIVDKVIETLEDQGYMIKVESVTTQDDTVIVSFYKDQPPVTFGSSAEGAVLDVFAQSLVDNLEDYSKVIYRIEGEAYVSGHYEFGIDQVYLEDSRKNTQ